MKQFHLILALLTCAMLVWNSAEAKCVLPVPDGGDVEPSAANIDGYVESISQERVVIVRTKTQRKVTVKIPAGQSIYTAFGGDGEVADLKPGQRTWVWLQGCKKTKAPVQISAYFQIYSKDPNDQP